MKNLLALSFSIAILFVIGCAGGASSGSVNLVTEASTEIIDLEPDWWLNPEEREGYVVGKAEGVSRDKSGARMKAQNMLINDFRQRTKSIAEGRSENFFKETGEDLDSEIMQSFSSVQNRNFLFLIFFEITIQVYENKNYCQYMIILVFKKEGMLFNKPSITY